MVLKNLKVDTEDSLLSSYNPLFSESSHLYHLSCDQDSIYGRPSGPTPPSDSAGPL